MINGINWGKVADLSNKLSQKSKVREKKYFAVFEKLSILLSGR
jgi:hypothetical protein